jgi:hypothetical protein
MRGQTPIMGYMSRRYLQLRANVEHDAAGRRASRSAYVLGSPQTSRYALQVRRKLTQGLNQNEATRRERVVESIGAFSYADVNNGSRRETEGFDAFERRAKRTRA